VLGVFWISFVSLEQQHGSLVSFVRCHWMILEFHLSVLGIDRNLNGDYFGYVPQLFLFYRYGHVILISVLNIVF